MLLAYLLLAFRYVPVDLIEAAEDGKAILNVVESSPNGLFPYTTEGAAISPYRRNHLGTYIGLSNLGQGARSVYTSRSHTTMFNVLLMRLY